MRKQCRLSLDEISSDPILDRKDKSCIELLNETIADLDDRFQEIVQFKEQCGFVFDVNSLAKIEDDDLEKGCKDVSLQLEGDIDPNELLTEILRIYNQPQEKCTALAVLQFICKYNIEDI